MTSNEDRSDAVLAALNDLPVWDVDERRAQSLGVQCRAVLATQKRAPAIAAHAGFGRWTHVTGRALLAIWCAVYVIEIVRRGAAAFGL
jgi:hypothetical protein